MCHQHTDLRVKIPPPFLKLSHMNLEQVGDYHQILAASPVRLGLAAHASGGGRIWGGGFSFVPLPTGADSWVSLSTPGALSASTINTPQRLQLKKPCVCLLVDEYRIPWLGNQSRCRPLGFGL